jgi:hypothetical protein
VSTEKRHQRGAKGVAKAAEEVVREELLGGVELAAGSVGWGNNRRRLPPARCSLRKTTVEGIPLPCFASRCCRKALDVGGAW